MHTIIRIAFSPLVLVSRQSRNGHWFVVQPSLANKIVPLELILPQKIKLSLEECG